MADAVLMPGERGELPPILDENHHFSPEWYNRYEALSGDVKSLSKFKSLESLAKSYAQLEKMKRYPGVEETDRMVAFRRMAGLPDEASEYLINRPEGIEEAEWNQPFAEHMAKIAYQYGVPPQAMDALGAACHAAQKDAAAELERREDDELEAASLELQEEWGGQYERGLEQARKAIIKLSDRAGLDARNVLEDQALASRPAFVRLMREAALLMGESPLHGGAGSPVSPSQEAKRIESDPSHPLHEAYMNHHHPNHRYANDMYDKLAFGK